MAAVNSTSLSSASPFWIEQMAPDATGVYNRLMLAGRCSPYKPFPDKLKLNYEKANYQGNPEASVQVLGIDYPAHTWQGKFRTKYMADLPPPGDTSMLDAISENIAGSITGALTGSVAPTPDTSRDPRAIAIHETRWQSGTPWLEKRLKTAVEARDLLKKLLRDGIPVQVTWDDLSWIGFIVNVEFEHDVREDIAYKIDWDWISDAKPTIAMAIDVQDLSQFPEGLLDKVRAFRKMVTAPARFASNILDAINQDIDLIESSIGELAGTVTDYTDLAADAVETLNNAIGIGMTIKGAAARIVDSIDAVNAEWCATTSNFSDVISAADFNRQTVESARDIGAYAGEMIDSMTIWREPDIIATFVASEDMDFRKVSTQYYQTPDHWTDLADYNGIEGSSIPRGFTVIVPRLPMKLG